ncbi:MAG: hypothetical protein GKS00_03425 [Alphaproteobacteria bacterium]|nr:hypothetical protein [Alphaproteobacteria bacterium]
MGETKTQSDDIRDFLQPCDPSQDPEYLAWKEAKLRRALAADLAAPEAAVPQHEVWKKFGLEY